MDAVMLTFVLIWLVVSFLGVWRPARVIRSFRTVSRVLGIDPENIGPTTLLSWRWFNALLFLLGVIVLIWLVSAQVSFETSPA